MNRRDPHIRQRFQDGDDKWWTVSMDGVMEPAADPEMAFPVRCRRCRNVHDCGNVEVIARYADCSVWKCPDCGAHLDDRAEGWGGGSITKLYE